MSKPWWRRGEENVEEAGVTVYAVVRRLNKFLEPKVEPSPEPEAEVESSPEAKPEYVSTHEYDKDGRLFFPSK
jgi:hypothetical protein